MPAGRDARQRRRLLHYADQQEAETGDPGADFRSEEYTFLAGSLVAESGKEKEVEHLVQPVRDVFAAIFFVSGGMLIEPALIAHCREVAEIIPLFGFYLQPAVGGRERRRGARARGRAPPWQRAGHQAPRARTDHGIAHLARSGEPDPEGRHGTS